MFNLYLYHLISELWIYEVTCTVSSKLKDTNKIQQKLAKLTFYFSILES